MHRHHHSHAADDEALAALSVLGLLSGTERHHFERHLAVCARCRLVVSEDRETIARLELASREMEPSPGLRERLLRRAAQELGADRAQLPTTDTLARMKLWRMQK